MSAYNNEEFAKFWNEKAGENGSPDKRFVIDPLMFQEVGDFTGKVVLELGCGNGYLAKRLLGAGAVRVIEMDISEVNLRYAREKIKDSRVTYILQDVTRPLDLANQSVDVVYSSFLFNEIEDIQTPFLESFRVLKPGGTFVFSVTHPSWDLYVYAQEKAGIPSDKIKGLKGYFEKHYSTFVMGMNNPVQFDVEHYHRTIEDFVKTLRGAGFQLSNLLEPQFNKEALEAYPKYAKYLDRPISLILSAKKGI